jgi:hypothetical protein
VLSRTHASCVRMGACPPELTQTVFPTDVWKLDLWGTGVHCDGVHRHAEGESSWPMDRLLTTAPGSQQVFPWALEPLSRLEAPVLSQNCSEMNEGTSHFLVEGFILILL